MTDFLTQFLTDLQNKTLRPDVMSTTVSDNIKYQDAQKVLGRGILDYSKPFSPSAPNSPIIKGIGNFQATPAEQRITTGYPQNAQAEVVTPVKQQAYQVQVPPAPPEIKSAITDLNENLAQRVAELPQRKTNLSAGLDALKESQDQYKKILDQIKEPAPDYTPSMDYQGELARLGEQDKNIKDVQEDPTARAIMMLAPAIASIFGGETGALAAPRAAAAGNEMYNAELKSARDQNLAKRKAISEKIDSLSKMQANDVVQFSEKQKIQLDRLKTALNSLNSDVINNRTYVKDETVRVDDIQNKLDDSLQNAVKTSVTGQQTQKKLDADAAKSLLKAKGKGAGGPSLQDVKFVNQAFNTQTKDIKGRLEGTDKIGALLDQIKSGNLKDAKTIANTLSSELLVLSTPTGMRPSVAALNRTAVDSFGTRLNNLINHYSWFGQLRGTIPPNQLQQFKNELDVFRKTYGEEARYRINGLKAQDKDPKRNGLYEDRWNESFAKAHKLDQATGLPSDLSSKKNIIKNPVTVQNPKTGEKMEIEKSDLQHALKDKWVEVK